MRFILLILCALEILLVTYLQNIAGPYISPLLFLITSISIGFVFLKISKTPVVAGSVYKPILTPTVTLALQLLIFCIFSYLIFKTLKTIWWWQATIDNGVDKSDIIAQITCLVKRFTAGQQPYYPISFAGYRLFPTYLPFQWMPYLLTEWLHKDYRWIPSIALWLASFYFFTKNNARHAGYGPLVVQLLLPVWPLIAWYAIIMYDNDMFKLTVEGLIAGYYLFVSASIGDKRVLLFASGMAVCLLSRYSIIFWAPFCIACYYIAGEKKNALLIAITLLSFFFAFYWFPFLRKDPSIFLKGYQYHSIAAYNEWQNDIQTLHSRFYVRDGFGFTSWALKLMPGDTKQVLSIYQQVHLVLCVVTTGLLLWYYVKKKAVYSLRAFLLFSFKIYLAVFYAFIQIPYKYLYIVPVIVSSSLLANAFNPKWIGQTIRRQNL